MDTPHVAGLHLSFLDSDACQKPFPDTSQQNVHWLCYYCNKRPAFGVTVVAKGLYGTIPENTQLKQPPVFIIGHWRTGTTLLHELLILDPRHNFPNTYQCLEPNHFLLTEKFFKSYFNFLLPTRRPMDNMEAGWDKPQEDEFALCMMGQPSPYLDVAFPNNPPLIRMPLK